MAASPCSLPLDAASVPSQASRSTALSRLVWCADSPEDAARERQAGLAGILNGALAQSPEARLVDAHSRDETSLAVAIGIR